MPAAPRMRASAAAARLTAMVVRDFDCEHCPCDGGTGTEVSSDESCDEVEEVGVGASHGVLLVVKEGGNSAEGIL